MKEGYDELEMEVIRFWTEDIIVCSYPSPEEDEGIPTPVNFSIFSEQDF